jgi:MFS family permease
MLQSLTLAALTLSGHINMTWVIALTLMQGLISAVEIPTRQSFVIKMVEDRADLTNAIALNSSNFNIARLVGPAIAGLLVAAVGEGYCFLIDGLSYIAVIAGLLMMRIQKDEPHRTRQHILTDLTEGWRYVFDFAPIRWILIFLGLIGIAGAPQYVLTPIIAGRVLHGGAHTLGFLMAAGGVGALICAIGLVLRRSVLGLGPLIALSVGLFSLANIGLGMSHWFWLSMLLMGVAGYGIMTQIVASNTIIQTIVDDSKRGRVMAFYAMALQGSIPIGSLAGGALAARVGAPATLIVSGVVCLVLTFWFWRKLPAMKKIVRARYAELGIAPES